MNQAIRLVHPVSDGILVEFSGGVCCYYSAEFLLSQVGKLSNVTFLRYDPKAEELPALLPYGLSHCSTGD